MLCSALTSITIPNSVTTIGQLTFNRCGSLRSVTISNSVTSIGKLAFHQCSSLSSVTIPGSVVTIDEYAFSECTALTSVTFSGSVETIGNYAFYECTALTSIAIPNSVRAIGERSFGGCSSLQSVTIGNAVQTIGLGAFADCTRLASVTIPNSVTTIGDWAFGECAALTSVVIPNSVTAIGERAFVRCTGLRSVTIGNALRTIGREAFGGCSALTSVAIPGTVTAIGDFAFHNCTGLTDVHVAWSTPLSIPGDVFRNVNVASVALYVPAGKEAAYKAADTWKNFYYPGGTAPELSVTPTTAHIPAEGGTASITVTANVGWTASSSASWATVSPSSGGSSGTVVIAATANTGTQRTATITFAGGGLVRTINVTQAAGGQDVFVDPVPPSNGEQSYLILRLGIPTDDPLSGTFLVILPPGMNLNLANTTLLGSLSNQYELVIKQLQAGIWQLEIKAKTSLRSAPASTLQEIVRIAWTEDQSLPHGSYEIRISDLEITLGDHTVIRKDEIKVQVTAGDPTGSETLEAQKVWSHAGRLYVRTAHAERIEIYALNGRLLHTARKDAGQAIFHLTTLPRGILIVRGTGGWSEKIVNH
jgi:hypothetical protein